MYISMPYFMSNSDWYYEEGDKYKLTDKAAPKARKSYEEYYKILEKASKPYVDENGVEWITT